jgi:predicted dehydrogenase
VTLGVGLVGLGWHGSRYASHLAKGEVPGLCLAAVTRRDRARGESQARELGCRFFASVEELARDREVDAFVVVSPGGAHPEHVRTAIRAGKPVLVEKPLAYSLAEVVSLLRESRELGARVMVAHTLRWEPVFERATALLPEIGRVSVAYAAFRRADFATRPSADASARGHHRGFFACGVHYFDWAGLLFPQGIARVQCHTPSGRGDLDAVAILGAKGGQSKLMLDLALASTANDDGFFLSGERGVLLGSRTTHRLELTSLGRSGPVELPPRTPTLPRVLASFRDFVLGEIENPVPLEAGARAVAIAEACARSVEKKSAADVSEDLP